MKAMLPEVVVIRTGLGASKRQFRLWKTKVPRGRPDTIFAEVPKGRRHMAAEGLSDRFSCSGQMDHELVSNNTRTFRSCFLWRHLVGSLCVHDSDSVTTYQTLSESIRLE
jgi:hypothetical protein